VPAPPLVDLTTIDLDRVAYDIEEIRKYNKQRYEMEQLTAVAHMDLDQRLIVAYKDVTEDEFWVRGHIPGRPLMPGVVMCEAAAQAASFLFLHCMEDPPDFFGFGGLKDVKFRGTVVPGDRFVVVAKVLTFRPGRSYALCQAQAFVEDRMVFEGKIIGVGL
jgi:3-hydroxyacyl-[acyl-carrier-protein] dehydratase